MKIIAIIGIIGIILVAFIFGIFSEIEYEKKERAYHKRRRELERRRKEYEKEARRRALAQLADVIEGKEIHFPNHDKEFIEELKNYHR